LTERYIFIGIGTVLMLVLSLLRRKQYNFPWWKAIVIPFILTLCGVAGTMILAYIESGKWGGISFYGSVLLIPVLLYPVSKLLRIPYGKITDYAVPQICIMLASMKVSCFITGCCGGICLNSETGVYFPSQIVEMIVAFAIMALVLFLDYKKKLNNALYGLFFLVYGVTRGILNFFRDGIKPFVWVIPAGHFWSIISIILGLIWIMVVIFKLEKNTKAEEPVVNA